MTSSQDDSNNSGGPNDADKKWLFGYATISSERIEEVTGEPITRYAENLVLIINSFFELGFLKDRHFNGKPIQHFWPLMEKLFDSQQSVAFVNEAFSE